MGDFLSKRLLHAFDVVRPVGVRLRGGHALGGKGDGDRDETRWAYEESG